MIEPIEPSDCDGLWDTLPSGVAVFTVEEAAKALRIGRSAAYEAVRRGQLPALRLGRKLRIPRSALERLLFGEPHDVGARCQEPEHVGYEEDSL